MFRFFEVKDVGHDLSLSLDDAHRCIMHHVHGYVDIIPDTTVLPIALLCSPVCSCQTFALPSDHPLSSFPPLPSLSSCTHTPHSVGCAPVSGQQDTASLIAEGQKFMAEKKYSQAESSFSAALGTLRRVAGTMPSHLPSVVCFPPRRMLTRLNPPPSQSTNTHT